MSHLKSEKTRENGFISIEMINDQPFLVHRSLAGVTHFKANILSKLSKVKHNGDKIVKVLVFVMNTDTNAIEKEQLNIEILETSD